MARVRQARNQGGEVVRSQFGIDEGDEKHPGSRPKKGHGFGVEYGQGIGYGGYDSETGGNPEPSRGRGANRKCEGAGA